MTYLENSLIGPETKRVSVSPDLSGGRGLAASALPCDGVVFFGNVDWWYHNRGHSSTRTATRLARRVPTLYVNSIGMRMPVPGRTEVAWGRYLRKIKSLARGLRRDEATGLWVYTPLFVPRYTAGWIEVNGRLLAAQVMLLRRMLGMRNPSAFVSMPTMTPAVERLPWSRVVAERCDDFSTMPGANAPVVAALERRLLGLCDHATYASSDLLERERMLPAQSHLIGHGVDAALLAAARPMQGPRPEPPESMRGLQRPVVGFFGAMDDYRMDLDLMVKVARSIAPGTLVLVGPAQMDLARLVAEPNVRLVGQVPPEQLGPHAAQFDVGIIPFLRNDFNLRSSPVKLKEYLAVGLPIVAVDLPAYRPYAGLIETAETHEDFLDALRRALLEDDPTLTLGRRKAVAGDDWEAVAERMAALLGVPPRPTGPTS
jgi:glycosyltransferase involved in cell wall biosynthesis